MGRLLGGAAAVAAALCAVPSRAQIVAPADPGAAAAVLDPFAATRLRPLFSPSRRPPPAPAPVVAVEAPAPVAAPPPPESTPDLALSGVVIGADARVAIVRHPQDAAPIHVTLGADVDGWTVAAIEPRSVTLKRADRVLTLGFPEPPK